MPDPGGAIGGVPGVDGPLGGVCDRNGFVSVPPDGAPGIAPGWMVGEETDDPATEGGCTIEVVPA